MLFSTKGEVIYRPFKARQPSANKLLFRYSPPTSTGAWSLEMQVSWINIWKYCTKKNNEESKKKKNGINNWMLVGTMTTGLTDVLRGINNARETAVINNELRLRVDIAAL